MNEFDKFFKKICKVEGVRSQSSLARFLGVSRASVSLAKKSGIVPGVWYELEGVKVILLELEGEKEPYLSIGDEHKLNRYLEGLKRDEKKRRGKGEE